ncbi:MAG: OmpA family protein [Pseudomonadota bacterium]
MARVAVRLCVLSSVGALAVMAAVSALTGSAVANAGEGSRLLNGGFSAPEARSFLQQIDQRDDDAASLLYRRAREAYYRGRLQHSIDLLAQVLRRFPNSLVASDAKLDIEAVRRVMRSLRQDRERFGTAPRHRSRAKRSADPARTRVEGGMRPSSASQSPQLPGPPETDLPALNKVEPGSPPARDHQPARQQSLASLQPTKPQADPNERFADESIDRVFFGEGITLLGQRGKEIVALQAKWLKQNGALQITIHGHADERGSRAYNLKVARDRARAVREALVKRGVARARITIRGLGRNDPIARCKGHVCAAQNRRVVTTVAASGVR